VNYEVNPTDSRSRFQLNVTAGSQKRAIANLRKSEGRDESRFALKMLSIFCNYLDESCYYLDNQSVWAFSRCVENDSQHNSVPLHEYCQTNTLSKYSRVG
jgi:hypothetical protein